jgi:hypothetical protein
MLSARLPNGKGRPARMTQSDGDDRSDELAAKGKMVVSLVFSEASKNNRFSKAV